METRTVVAAVVLLACIPLGMAERPAAAEPYDVKEAYEVYGVLLPHEESYGFSKGMLVIQQDMIREQQSYSSCLAVEAAKKFKDAISDFDRLGRKSWLLQRKFEISKPYTLVGADTINQLFHQLPGGWETFYKLYPGSGGYLVMSPVGFNKDKTLAIVYTGSACGGLCGSWRFHLLEKVQGTWKEAPGVICSLVS